MTERYKLVEPRLIASHLPENPDVSIRIVYASGYDLAILATCREVVALADKEIIGGIWDTKKKVLKRCFLLKSVRYAHRVLRGLRRPLLPSMAISKAKQVRGAPKWVTRHDAAKSGHRTFIRQTQTALPDSETDQAIRAVEVESIAKRYQYRIPVSRKQKTAS